MFWAFLSLVKYLLTVSTDWHRIKIRFYHLSQHKQTWWLKQDRSLFFSCKSLHVGHAGQVWQPLGVIRDSASYLFALPSTLVASSSKPLHGVRWLLEAFMGCKEEEKQRGRKRPFPNKSAPFKQSSKESHIMLPPTSHWLESIHLATFGRRVAGKYRRILGIAEWQYAQFKMRTN